MKKAILVFAFAAALTLMSAGVALAATGTNIPHGGYSVSTDACLQCHDVHEATGDYVLMRWATVVDVCATCHGLYNSQPTASIKLTTLPDPDINGGTRQNPGASTGPDWLLNYDPGYSGDEVVAPGTTDGGTGGPDPTQVVSGPASPYAVYHVGSTAATNHNGHRMGIQMAGIGQFLHADGI